jgi:tRNA A37 N6-isopentenylltransferase MiaA
MDTMEEQLKFELRPDTVDNLLAFSEMLGKDINTMLEEALQRYFEEEQQKLIEKGIEEDASMTNLDYDEFWEGLDIG